MSVAEGSAQSQQCEHKHQKASRLRGGGAGKVCNFLEPPTLLPLSTSVPPCCLLHVFCCPLPGTILTR